MFLGSMSDRHEILNDQDFWTRLEFVASRWLETSDDRNLRRFWVDGFQPEIARDTRFGVDVEGMAWVGKGSRNQFQYRFVVELPQKMLHRRTPGFVIEQLSLDEGNKALQIELARLEPIAEPGTSPNGGPGTSSGNPALTEGPPSLTSPLSPT